MKTERKSFRIDWSRVDWRKNDSFLADELKCNRRAVWQARKRLKAPRWEIKNNWLRRTIRFQGKIWRLSKATEEELIFKIENPD